MNKLSFTAFVTAFLVSAAFPVHVRAASAGDLVKCKDYSAVYYLAEDGERYVFPNERIYLSWYSDFRDVKTISCDDLATLPLGDRIVYQAGTRLVKIPSNPSVYAVEDDGVLREIPDEETAIELFGEDWGDRVDDVSEAFWPSFTIGTPLTEGEIPEGTIVADDDGDLFRVEDDGTATEIGTVLTTDQEDVLEAHALSLDDVEERLGVALALTRVDASAAIAVLEELIARLRTVHIEDDDVVSVEEFEDVEDEDDAEEDAQDAIDDAEEEIADAESDIAEDERDGKDVTASEALLASAREHLVLAQDAFIAGDFSSAEQHADEARQDAMWARGKAVDSIEDEDEADDEEDAIDDEDETDDETGTEDEDTESDDAADNEDTEDSEEEDEGDESDESDDSGDSDDSDDSGSDSSGSGSDDE